MDPLGTSKWSKQHNNFAPHQVFQKVVKRVPNEFAHSNNVWGRTTFPKNNSVLVPYVSRALKTSVHFYQTDLVRKGTSFEAVDKWYLPVSAIWSEFHTLPSTHRHPQRTSVHNNAMLMLALEMPSNGHRSTLLQCLPDKAHQQVFLRRWQLLKISQPCTNHGRKLQHSLHHGSTKRCEHRQNEKYIYLHSFGSWQAPKNQQRSAKKHTRRGIAG